MSGRSRTTRPSGSSEPSGRALRAEPTRLSLQTESQAEGSAQAQDEASRRGLGEVSPRSAERSAWQLILSLGEQLLAQPTVAAQRELIVETAARLVEGRADLWLAEAVHRLPGVASPAGESPPFPQEPHSDLMRRALDSRPTLLSREADTGGALAVAVPLIIHDDVLGVLEVERPDGPPFSDAEVGLLDSLAAQSAVALQAARQVAVGRLRVEQLTLVRRVSSAVASILDLDALLDEVVTLIRERFGYPCVYLFTVDPARNQIVCRAGLSFPSANGELEGGDPRDRVSQVEGLAHSMDEPEGIVPWVACHGETVLANDVSRDPRYRPAELPPADTRAELAVPLIFGGEVLGVLDVHSDRREGFGDDDRFLFEALADSVAIAIRNANLYRSERWRRQVADSLREVAGLLSADVALDQVLEAVLAELERTLPCDAAGIWLLRDGDLRLAAAHGSTADGTVSDFPSDVSPWLRDVLHADRPVIRAPGSPPEPLGTGLDLPPDYSAIAAPLRAGDRRLGVLTLVHRTAGRYGTASRMMTAAFASYAAVAIENARLYQDAQEQALISTVMLRVVEATRSLTTPSQVLEAVVHLVPMLVGVERCAILLWDDADSGHPTAAAFVPVAACGISPAEQTTFDEWRIVPGDEPAFDELRLNKAPIYIYDVTTDPRLSGPVVWALGFDSLLLLPLLAQGEVLGAMLVDYQVDRFGSGTAHPLRDERLAIVQGIAHQTAATVENARLREAQREDAYVSAALLQVAQAVASLNDLDDVLSTIVRTLPILVGVERCIICLWDDERSVFRPAQAYGVPRDAEAMLLAQRYAPGDFPLLDDVRKRDRPIVHSPGAPPDSFNEGDELVPPDFVAAFGPISAGASPGESPSLRAVPLSVKGDVLGVMVLEEASTSHRSRERRLEIITGIGHQTALAVQNDRLQREMAERERLERELQLAHEIQQTFMPSQSPDLRAWELAFAWRAARQVAGDFYDFFELPGRRLGLVIADVADKGMPAALFMALTRTLMRAAALEETSPAAALARVNDLLVPDAQHGMFVTAVYAVLSLKTGKLVYANAGHNLPLLLRSRTGELERLEKGGMALGVLEGVRLEERVVSLEPKDYLILYTDGITEAFSPQGDAYGEGHLRAVIRSASGSAAQAMLETIADSVTAFVGDTALSDDRTLMVLHRLK